MAQSKFALIGAGGVKNLVSLGDLDTWMDQQVAARTSGGGDIAKFYQAVPWLFLGTDLRASGIASLPFDILEGDEVVDSSDDYQNVLGFLPDPETLFWMWEASLTLTGKAYTYRTHNRIATLDLSYKQPYTIKPKIDKRAGLLGFERKNGAETVMWNVEDVFYLWHPDPFVELGEPMNYPALAARNASGVLFSLDTFVEAFFDRGAIKTTLVALKGASDQKERERFKETWKKAMQGIRNAWEALVVNADALTAEIIGEGVKDLQNTELSTNMREGIAGALKIPQTMLFSGSAAGLGGGGVSDADMLKFLKQFVIPRSKWIANQFNKQVLLPMGYRLRFKPETLDELQEDEVARASALSTFVDVLDKCSTWEQFEASASVLGYEYTEEVEAKLKAYFAAKETRRQEMQAQTQANTEQGRSAEPANMVVTKPVPPQLTAGNEDGESVADAAKALERKQFKKHAKNGNGKPFTFRYLDADEQQELTGASNPLSAGVKKKTVKSIGATSQRFEQELTGLVRDAWATGEGTIKRDMSALVKQYCEDSYMEGLLDGGWTPDQMSDADRALIDDLTAEQVGYIAQFAKDVKDATGDAAQQQSIYRRIGLWAESIYKIGQRGWAQARAKVKRRIIWNTANDELTCPICEPLNGKIVEAGKPFAPGIYNEPAHPNCRCQTIDYVEASDIQ